MTGKIIKGIGGFYYIHTAGDRVYSCRAVGIFRKLGIKPLPGDNVEFDILDESRLEGSLTGILERRNELIRPAAANIDQAMIVFAVREPDPNLYVLDEFLISMELLKIPAVIYFNKADLDRDGLLDKYRGIYENAGFKVITGSTSRREDTALVREALKGHTTILAGPSGVGKSSLTNMLFEGHRMDIGGLSEKIRRGKQTTRHTELFSLDDESFVLDTPGFTSFTLTGIKSSELQYYFGEFERFIPECRFTGCSHLKEADNICAVKRAVRDGVIPKERYGNYVQIFGELKSREY